jgi:hypothetical protein
METLTTHKTKLNSINVLTIEIEENFSNEYSIVAFDNEGGVFIEKFAKTLEEAKKIAEKLNTTISKKY